MGQGWIVMVMVKSGLGWECGEGTFYNVKEWDNKVRYVARLMK